ncbi:MAG: hypothetical protein M1607_04295 [Patescibacteria group bacterium]|nr:hypothetical protein [Patescibacteria group bacterium]
MTDNKDLEILSSPTPEETELHQRWDQIAAEQKRAGMGQSSTVESDSNGRRVNLSDAIAKLRSEAPGWKTPTEEEVKQRREQQKTRRFRHEH